MAGMRFTLRFPPNFALAEPPTWATFAPNLTSFGEIFLTYICYCPLEICEIGLNYSVQKKDTSLTEAGSFYRAIIRNDKIPAKNYLNFLGQREGTWSVEFVLIIKSHHCDRSMLNKYLFWVLGFLPNEQR